MKKDHEESIKKKKIPEKPGMEKLYAPFLRLFDDVK